jgi:hypothetical protein
MAILAKFLRNAIIVSVAACGGHGSSAEPGDGGDMGHDFGFVGSGGYGHLDGGRFSDGSATVVEAGGNDSGTVDDASATSDDGGVAADSSDVDAGVVVDGGTGVGVTVHGDTGFFVFLDWSISGPSGAYSGRVYFGDAQSIEFVVGGIEAGSGYTITLSGTDRYGLPCTGTSAPFAVKTGAVTGAPVVIECLVPIDAGTAG